MVALQRSLTTRGLMPAGPSVCRAHASRPCYLQRRSHGDPKAPLQTRLLAGRTLPPASCALAQKSLRSPSACCNRCRALCGSVESARPALPLITAEACPRESTASPGSVITRLSPPPLFLFLFSPWVTIWGQLRRMMPVTPRCKQQAEGAGSRGCYGCHCLLL